MVCCILTKCHAPADEAVDRTPLTAGQNDSSNIDRAKRQPLDGKGQPGSSAGMPGTFRQVDSSSGTSPRTPPQKESPRRLATSWDDSPEVSFADRIFTEP